MRISDWSSDVCSSDLSPELYRSVRYLPDRESAWMERHRPFCCPERTGKRPAPKWQAGKEGSSYRPVSHRLSPTGNERKQRPEMPRQIAEVLSVVLRGWLTGLQFKVR